MAKYQTGGLIDNRPPEAQAKNWIHDEIAAASAPVNWVEKDPSTYRSFPERFQDQSFSCMAQSGEKTLGVENANVAGVFPVLSAQPVYQGRVNAPQAGMFQYDLFARLTKDLSPLESEVPSQHMSEDQLNVPVVLSGSETADADKYKANSYIFFNVAINTTTGKVQNALDIDQVASVIAQGKAVHLMNFFTDAEWWVPYPSLIEADLTLYNGSEHHGVSAVDFTLYKGEKALIIEDSAGNDTGIGGHGQRVVTESFLKARCYGAGYLIKTLSAPSKPQHVFTQPLTYGMVNNADVTELQAILQYEGFMASIVDGAPFAPTGNFFGMTAAALKAWQIAHGIEDFANDPNVADVRFGQKSIDLANKLYK